MGAVDIDEALDRLIAAHDHAGLDPVRPAPAGVEQHLERIREQILPLRLPEDVARFWRRIDVSTISVAPMPGPSGPEFSLDGWVMHCQTRPLMYPRLLFPVFYQSHMFLSVELEDGRGSGGPLLAWEYAGDGYRVAAASLADYVDLLAMWIDAREFRHVHHEGRSWPVFNYESDWKQVRDARVTAAGSLGALGAARHIGEDPKDWPTHWLAAEGIDTDALRPRGATTTIADLLRRATTGVDAAGTIQVRVGRVIFTDAGGRWEVSDGTGTLDLWCPAAVMTYAAGRYRGYEVDVVVHPPRPQVPTERSGRDLTGDVQAAARAHDIAGAQAAAVELYRAMFETRAQAEAVAVRPLD
ncbi:MAG TPA: hypothetical protein VGC04_04495 [Cellulomonas sp.]